MGGRLTYESTVTGCGIYPGTGLDPGGGVFFDRTVTPLESAGMTYCPWCDGEPWNRMRKCSCCSGTGLIEIVYARAHFDE